MSIEGACSNSEKYEVTLIPAFYIRVGHRSLVHVCLAMSLGALGDRPKSAKSGRSKHEWPGHKRQISNVAHNPTGIRFSNLT